MSTATDVTPETTDATTEAPVVAEKVDQTDPANFPAPAAVDEFGAIAYSKAVADRIELNRLSAEIKSIGGTENDIVEHLKQQDNVDNGGPIDTASSNVTKLDKALDVEIQKWESLLKAKAQEQLSSGASVIQPLLDQVEVVGKRVKSATNYLTDLYGEDVVNTLPELKKGRKASSGGGAGGARIRGFDYFVDGKLAALKTSQNTLGASSTSAVAKLIGVDTKVAQEAFWQAQGTQDPKAFKDVVEYTMTVGEGADAVTHSLVARKRADAEVSSAPTAE